MINKLVLLERLQIQEKALRWRFKPIGKEFTVIDTKSVEGKKTGEDVSAKRR